MDVKDIDIDNFNWEKPHTYAIINGVLMDRNLMGCGIQGVTAYAIARNGRRWGHTTCAICGVSYSNQNIKVGSNHIRSIRHQNAVNGKFPIEKRKRKVY